MDDSRLITDHRKPSLYIYIYQVSMQKIE